MRKYCLILFLELYSGFFFVSDVLKELIYENWPGDKFFKPKKSKFWERLSSNF